MANDTANNSSVNFRDALFARLRSQPDVAEALAALPDLGARARYLRAVFARLADHTDPLVAASLRHSLASIKTDDAIGALAPRAGIVLSRHFNTTKKREVIDVDGAPLAVPAAVANLLRDALAATEFEADRRTVRDMERLLPALAGLLVDTNRKGSTKDRVRYAVDHAVRARVSLS